MRASFIIKTTIITAGLCLAAWTSMAQANIISGTPNVDFNNGSYTLSLASGAATYTFSDTNSRPDSVAVQTGGGALIASLFGSPDSFFTDESRAPYINGNGLDSFESYDTPTPISFSLNDAYLELALDLSDGRHYGYARIDGPSLLSFGYQSQPGAGIQAGATGQAAAVPEPPEIGLFVFALTLLGFGIAARQRRKI